MTLIDQLNCIFYPQSIAVIGVSDNPTKLGFFCVKSLIEAGFQGKIYPVHPELSEVLSLKVHPSIGDIPGEIDLAIIAIPADHTLPVIEECVAKGVKGTVMFTSGLGELGTEAGLNLQDRIREKADEGEMKIIGPNSLGFLNPPTSLNATFSPELGATKAGSVAVATQSGGVSAYVATTFTDNNIGISKLISMGNRCNLHFDEILQYLAQDDETKVIALHIEGLDRPRKFMEIARQTTKRKPVIAYKVGRKEELNQASLSHTNALAGKYELYQAAFTQTGIIAVNSITELADVSKALAFQPLPSGNRVAVISTPAGLALILADKCYELGLRLAEFSPETLKRLRQLISPMNSTANPVDVAWTSTDADASREVLKAVLEDNGVDMVVIGLIYANTQFSVALAARDIFSKYRKPAVVTCLESPIREDNRKIIELEESGIPVYPLPERAVTGLAGLAKYREILKAFC